MNPTISEELKRFFNLAPFIADLGIRLDSLGHGPCTTALLLQPRHLQPIRNSSLDSHIGETSVTPNDFDSFFLRHPNMFRTRSDEGGSATPHMDFLRSR